MCACGVVVVLRQTPIGDEVRQLQNNEWMIWEVTSELKLFGVASPFNLPSFLVDALAAGERAWPLSSPFSSVFGSSPHGSSEDRE